VAAALGVAAFATTGLWSACAADAATGQLPGVGNANAVAVDASGRIITAGNSFDFLLARFKRSGALDKSFGLGGKVITKFGDKEAAANDLAIDSSGRIVAAGFAGKRVALARYNRNGTLDKTFGRRGKVTTQLGRPPVKTSTMRPPSPSTALGRS
jgi:uncharacterized delta-60 repeat protein